MTQRLRWSMGSLQIFLHTNPLLFDGLTWCQALLFFASVLQYWMAVPVLCLVLYVPCFLLSRIPPFSAPLLGFCTFFYSSYFLNRAMLYQFNTTRPRTDLDLQAGADMFIYVRARPARAVSPRAARAQPALRPRRARALPCARADH